MDPEVEVSMLGDNICTLQQCYTNKWSGCILTVQEGTAPHVAEEQPKKSPDTCSFSL